MNTVTLIGRLGKDPEMRYTPGGKAVATVSLATQGTRKDAEGQYIADWHNLEAWEKTAELLNVHCKVGHRLGVEGSIRYDSWDGDDGKKHYRTKIVVHRIHFLEPKDASATAAPRNAPEEDDYPF